MSGPIVRRYGFPNFDQIFGKKDLQHGVEGQEPTKGESPATSDQTTKPTATTPKSTTEK